VPSLTRLLWILAAGLSTVALGASDKKTMFPVPAGAEKPGHVVLQPRIAEQDYFWIKAEYPATPALDHYEKIFANWRQCGTPVEGWDGYGDMSHGENSYLHNFVRYWISPANDRAVTVLFRYRSTGAAHRKRPDNDDQFVAVIQHRVSDAAAHFATIDVQCPKAPNNTVERDARKSGARPSP
jgi:hypothetical protein